MGVFNHKKEMECFAQGYEIGLAQGQATCEDVMEENRGNPHAVGAAAEVSRRIGELLDTAGQVSGRPA
jgi:hypothetical protein